MTTQELLDTAKSLPAEDRALIADSLLQTLNPPIEEIDRRWAQVALERLAEIESGKVNAIPGEDVFNRIWSRLNH